MPPQAVVLSWRRPWRLSRSPRISLLSARSCAGSASTPESWIAVGKVRIKGIEQLERKLAELPDAIERAARRAVKSETHDVAQELRRDVPVDEGVLHDSIQEEISNGGLTGRATVTAKYAGYVIHGTSDTPANDFVTPVEIEARKRFPERVKDELREELRRM